MRDRVGVRVRAGVGEAECAQLGLAQLLRELQAGHELGHRVRKPAAIERDGAGRQMHIGHAAPVRGHSPGAGLGLGLGLGLGIQQVKAAADDALGTPQVVCGSVGRRLLSAQQRQRQQRANLPVRLLVRPRVLVRAWAWARARARAQVGGLGLRLR
jgi:hypothetical protein